MGCCRDCVYRDKETYWYDRKFDGTVIRQEHCKLHNTYHVEGSWKSCPDHKVNSYLSITFARMTS